jgi:hypothetical protein
MQHSLIDGYDSRLTFLQIAFALATNSFTCVTDIERVFGKMWETKVGMTGVTKFEFIRSAFGSSHSVTATERFVVFFIRKKYFLCVVFSYFYTLRMQRVRN